MIRKNDKSVVAVSELADYLLANGLNDKFRELATHKKHALSLTDIEKLRSMFHNPPEESKYYNVEKHGLGGWLSACQFSIFELIYNYGEDALPFIREIAWGVYDWTQGNAIELLIRFAADGIHKKDLIKEIKEKYPKIRYEAQLYAIQPLLSELESNPNLKSVFSELMKIEEFKEVYEELFDNDA